MGNREGVGGLTGSCYFRGHVRLPFGQLGLHASDHEVDLILTLRVPALDSVELAGLFHEALEADLPDQDLIAFEFAVPLEHFAALDGVRTVGERKGAVPRASVAGGQVSVSNHKPYGGMPDPDAK